jgi:polyribonucleotide nucleotidyltransferase
MRTADAILMVEAGAKGVSEQVVLEALEMAHEAIKQVCAGQLELQREVGKPKFEYTPPPFPAQIVEVVSEYLALRLDAAAFNPDKAARETAVNELRKRTIAELGERFPEHADILGKLFDKKVKDRVRQRIIEEGVRPDGAATHAWLRSIHPRPDPGADDRNAGVDVRPAEAGRAFAGRVQALHAPLQLPAVLRR